MSDTVTVDIHTPSSEIIEGAEIPNDYTIQEVIDEAIDELQLPRIDSDGVPIEYNLYSINSKTYLPPLATVAVSLRNGDAVRLDAKSNGQVLEVSPGIGAVIPPTVGDNPSEITVVLVVLDLNRTEQVTLSTTRPVGELVRQIVGSYSLPPRDKLGQINKYRLKSKALGSFLLDTTTLAKEGVPTLDRLTLHRDEIAGGRSVGNSEAEVGVLTALNDGERIFYGQRPKVASGETSSVVMAILSSLAE